MTDDAHRCCPFCDERPLERPDGHTCGDPRCVEPFVALCEIT